MKIVSKFRDYYDGCLSYGHDESIVYLREQTSFSASYRTKFDIEIPPILDPVFKDMLELTYPKTQVRASTKSSWMTSLSNRIPEKLLSSQSKRTIEVYPFVIIFCGKQYKGIELYSPAERKIVDTKLLISEVTSPEIHYFCYSFDDFVSFAERHQISSMQIKYERSSSWDAKFIKLWFDHNHTIDVNYLIEHKITSIAYSSRYSTVILNPKLQEFGFYQILDSYSAFQELEMWMGGTLSYPHNVMIELTEEDRINQHGFDPKYGFRKRPKGSKK